MQLDHFFNIVLEEQCFKLFSHRDNMSFSFVDLETLAAAQYTEIADQVLFAEELRRFKSFRIGKRKVEFLGGRLAAKRAVKARRQAVEKGFKDAHIVIEAGKAGRPTLRKIPDLDVSISHSGTLAGAMVGKQMTCGLDLQKITPQVLKIRERFVTHKDEMLLKKLSGNSSNEALYTLLWSVKEALRKAVPKKPLLGFLEMELTQIIPKAHSNAFIFQIPCTEAPDHLTEVIAFFYQRTAIASCILAGG